MVKPKPKRPPTPPYDPQYDHITSHKLTQRKRYIVPYMNRQTGRWDIDKKDKAMLAKLQ